MVLILGVLNEGNFALNLRWPGLLLKVTDLVSALHYKDVGPVLFDVTRDAFQYLAGGKLRV